MVAFPLLPIAPLPQVDFPTIQVSAELPGASPETMASTVAAPLERRFGQISGITQMTSTSVLGSTSTKLTLDKVGRLCLPENLTATAGISDKAQLLGRIDKFELWNPDKRTGVSQGRPTISIAHQALLRPR